MFWKKKYKVVTTFTEGILYKYFIEIVMQNGQVFNTRRVDGVYDSKYTKYNNVLRYHRIDYIEPTITVNKNWTIENTNFMTTILNSENISHIRYTKEIHESITLVNDELEEIK